MKGLLRLSTLAGAGALALIAGLSAAFAADPVDTARLPRVSGAESVYESVASTIFSSPASVSATAEALTRTLEADGWRSYVAPFTSTAENPDSIQLTFKKDDRAISVFVVVAPARNNVTSVQYGNIPLANDLPFPPDATNIEFSPERPHLIVKTAASIEEAMAFFARELAARGWSAWSTRDAAKIPPGGKVGETSPTGGYAHFIRDGKPPLMLTLKRDDERTRAEIKVVSASELDPRAARAAADAARQREAAQRAAAQEEARKRFAEEERKFDQLGADLVRDALKGATAPPRPTQPATSDARPAVRAGADAPVPVPDTAEGLKVDSGKLDYTSASSVAALADFHRAAMKALGWREQPSVINRPNMVVLDFQQSGKKVNFTIMQFGPPTKVSANGSGLATVASSAPSATSTAPIVELAATDSGGLPVPKENTSVGASTTPFRVEATATVSADIRSVLVFYRRELTARGWREEARGAESTDRRARLEFTSAEGPAILKLERKSDATNIELTLRKASELQKSGLTPKPGQAKVIFGNVMTSESTVSLAGKTIKIGAGVGEKAPDGPSMDIKPGKYRYTVKNGAKSLQGDEITIAPGEVWGVLVGPGGGLTLQVY